MMDAGACKTAEANLRTELANLLEKAVEMAAAHRASACTAADNLVGAQPECGAEGTPPIEEAGLIPPFMAQVRTIMSDIDRAAAELDRITSAIG